MRTPVSSALRLTTLLTVLAVTPALAVDPAADSITAPSAVTIQQDRDEPGRNPYQVHVIFPASCGAYDCTVHVPKLAVSQRIVVQQVSCSISTPNTNPPFLVFLAGAVRDPYLRAYLPVTFTGSNGSINFYTVNAPVLFYYVKGDMPTIDIYRSGGPAASPQGDCALSGYRVNLP